MKMSNAEIQQILGKNIKKLRLSYNYKVDEFAKILNISDPFLRQIEVGKKGLSLYKLIELSDMFNIKIEDLLNDLPNSEQQVDFSKRLSVLSNMLTASEQETLALLLKAYHDNKPTPST